MSTGEWEGCFALYIYRFNTLWYVQFTVYTVIGTEQKCFNFISKPCFWEKNIYIFRSNTLNNLSFKFIDDKVLYTVHMNPGIGHGRGHFPRKDDSCDSILPIYSTVNHLSFWNKYSYLCFSLGAGTHSNWHSFYDVKWVNYLFNMFVLILTMFWLCRVADPDPALFWRTCIIHILSHK